MIILHHLNKSRSKRIIWLLEELNVEYQIKAYQRDRQSNLAPPELKAIHPLGKSPVIELNGTVLAESGAIIEYLTQTYANDSLMPPQSASSYHEYLQWLHFAESSAALPLLLHYFLKIDGAKTNFLEGYAQQEIALVLGYLNKHMQDRAWLLGDEFSAADIMISFIIEMAFSLGLLNDYPNLGRYLQAMHERAGAQKAAMLEQQYDNSVTSN